MVVYQPGECFLGVMCRTHGRWLVERGYNNCTVPGLSIYPVRDILSHKTQSKKRRLALWSTYSRCNFINTACMVAKIGSVPRETLPNRPPKSIRKQRTKRYKTTGYRSKIRILQALEKFSCICSTCTRVVYICYCNSLCVLPFTFTCRLSTFFATTSPVFVGIVVFLFFLLTALFVRPILFASL